MKIFLEETPEIIEPFSPSLDRAIVVNPKQPLIERKQHNDFVKEMAALDALALGVDKAAEINGVSRTSANDYSHGKDISNPDVRARILATKYDIQDVAVAKLMDTLNLIDPSNITKQRDLIAVATGLGSIVDKMADQSADQKPQVHLHLFSPSQKKEKEYTTIDV